MAISGSFYGTTSNVAIKPKISWSAEKNEEGNYSDVTATLSYSRTDSYKTYGYWAGTLTINGNKKTQSGTYIEITYNSNTVTVTHTVRVPHADDGTMTVEITGTGSISGTTLTKTTITAQVALESIPRAASVAATDADIGSVSMVTIGKKSDSYTYTVAWKFGSLSGFLTPEGISEEAEHVTASSLAFTLPERFYDEIPNEKTGVCTLTCTTYLADTPIGTPQQADFTVRADPARCAPVLTVSAEDIHEAALALTGNKNRFIRTVSTARCVIIAQPRHGAAITLKRIAGKTVTGDTLDLTQVEAETVRFLATDSRGYTTEKLLTLDLVPYFAPTLRIRAARTDATGGGAKLQAEGSFYNASFGAGSNTLRLHCRIEDGTTIALQPEVEGNDFALEHLLENLDYTRAFTVTVTASDALSSTTASVRINPGIPVFDWGEGDMRFRVPVSLAGNRLTDLAAPENEGDAVSLGYALQAFAPIDDYCAKCVTVTTAGTNLDDYKEEGWYCFYSSAVKPANVPAGSNGWLHVLSNTGPNGVTYTKQFWYRMGTPGTNDYEMYVRSTTSALDSWGGWTRYVTEKDAYQMVKLWENANPGSSFAAQTLALDLTGYDGITVFYRNGGTGAAHISSGFLPKGMLSNLWYVYSEGNQAYRQCTAKDSGIQFTAGHLSGATNNTVILPVHIYGIKGVSA